MSSYEEDVELMMLWTALQTLKRKRKPRKMWVRYIYQLRTKKSQYYNILQEMRLYDREQYFK